MVKITSLCNAGFALEYNGSILLIDVPCKSYGPYFGLPESDWMAIYKKQRPYDKVCGIYITHDHPDHCDLDMLEQYRKRWPDTPVFLPAEDTEGVIQWGPFRLEYQSFPHAPMLHGVPPHVVTWITAGEKRIYLAADAALEAGTSPSIPERQKSRCGDMERDVFVQTGHQIAAAGCG